MSYDAPSSGVVTTFPPRRRILLVEPQDELRTDLVATVESIATIYACSDFETARQQIAAHPPDLLVTDLRLRAYNGIHLALVVRRDGLSTRTIVYADPPDLGMAPWVHAANAFFELTSRLPVVLPAYATAVLPASDRRNPRTFDRRSVPRGGRRVFDQYQITLST
jgi:CheY-like chemotaxis protein